MKCRNPYHAAGYMYPCGQCMPCRVNRRRIWTHRLMLERFNHGDATFVTLTYDDEHLPEVLDKDTGEILNTLVPKHLQDWLKRLRKAYAPKKIRFYGCGEYGDTSDRAHYHVALFGYPQCEWGTSRYSRSRKNCCWSCDLLRSTWGQGNIYSGELTAESSAYISGYVTKKMTSKEDQRLRGRHPEFARMSNRPGIGADFMHHVASSILEFNLGDKQADVPSALRHGNRVLPLGRYLRMKLRKMVGKDEKTPQEILDKLFAELQPLRDLAQATSDETGEKYGEAFKRLVIKQSDQAVLNMETRQKIFKSRKTL